MVYVTEKTDCFEEMDQELDDGHQWLPQIYQAACFWSDSKS